MFQANATLESIKSKGECPIGLSRSRFGRSGCRMMALTRLWKDDFESSSFPFSYDGDGTQNRVLLSPEKVFVAVVWEVEWLESVISWQFGVSFLDVYMRVGCHQRKRTPCLESLFLLPALTNPPFQYAWIAQWIREGRPRRNKGCVTKPSLFGSTRDFLKGELQIELRYRSPLAFFFLLLIAVRMNNEIEDPLEHWFGHK